MKVARILITDDAESENLNEKIQYVWHALRRASQRKELTNESTFFSVISAPDFLLATILPWLAHVAELPPSGSYRALVR